MRRIGTILLWLCLLLSLCACGQAGSADPLPFIPAGAKSLGTMNKK